VANAVVVEPRVLCASAFQI